jgi:hypothetical protein
MRSVILSLFMVLVAAVSTSGVMPDPGKAPANQAVLARQLGEIRFTQNKGQVRDNQGQLRPDVLFSAGGNDFKFYFTKKGIIYAWIQTEELMDGPYRKELSAKAEPALLLSRRSGSKKYKTYQMNMELIGANPQAAIQAEDPTPDVAHYFLDHCPGGIMNVRSYQKIVYQEVYAHIDLVVYTSSKGLKYDFIVKPGGKVSDIRFKYTGSEAVRLRPNGTLIIDNLFGSIQEGKPYTYQMIRGKEKKVPSKYVVNRNTISFKTGKYNPLDTLTIDPAVAWASYYGGAGQEIGTEIVTDQSGNVYMAGWTNSMSGIAHKGFQPVYGGGGPDAFLVKFTPAGQRVWATYYGKDRFENAEDLALDAVGNIYLAGSTYDPDAVFLVKFSPDGAFLWEAPIKAPGTNFKVGANPSITVDRSGVYLCGNTDDPAFISKPLKGPTLGVLNAFLIKYPLEKGEMVWGTYLGGDQETDGHSITVDKDGNIYMAGGTSSTTGIASNGFQNMKGGTVDAFLVKFNPSGLRIWGTYYGGSQQDYATSVATDSEGNILLAGETQSGNNLTTLDGFQPVYGGGDADALLVKFSPDGERVWGTYTVKEVLIKVLTSVVIWQGIFTW